MKRLLCAMPLLFCLCATSWGVPLMFDVDDNDDANSVTQAGWTSVSQSNINNVTFTAVGAGVVIDDRDRGTGNGGGAEAAMWRDFIFASGSDAAGEGLDISVSGLLANTTYDVRLWAFDDSSNGNRSALWNGNVLTFPDSPDPSSLLDDVVSFQAMTDGAGLLLLQGRTNAAAPGPAHNVFVNGFELTAQLVPEPSTLALWIVLGAAGIGCLCWCQRRRG